MGQWDSGGLFVISGFPSFGIVFIFCESDVDKFFSLVTSSFDNPSICPVGYYGFGIELVAAIPAPLFDMLLELLNGVIFSLFEKDGFPEFFEGFPFTDKRVEIAFVDGRKDIRAVLRTGNKVAVGEFAEIGFKQNGLRYALFLFAGFVFLQFVFQPLVLVFQRPDTPRLSVNGVLRYPQRANYGVIANGGKDFVKNPQFEGFRSGQLRFRNKTEKVAFGDDRYFPYSVARGDAAFCYVPAMAGQGFARIGVPQGFCHIRSRKADFTVDFGYSYFAELRTVENLDT
jgi:hypothetical protein